MGSLENRLQIAVSGRSIETVVMLMITSILRETSQKNKEIL